MQQRSPQLFDCLNGLAKPLVVNSTVLGGRVLFAGEDTRIHPINPYPVYRPAELRAILEAKPSEAELIYLNEAKKTFGLDQRFEMKPRDPNELARVSMHAPAPTPQAPVPAAVPDKATPQQQPQAALFEGMK